MIVKNCCVERVVLLNSKRNKDSKKKYEKNTVDCVARQASFDTIFAECLRVLGK